MYPQEQSSKDGNKISSEKNESRVSNNSANVLRTINEDAENTPKVKDKEDPNSNGKMEYEQEEDYGMEVKAPVINRQNSLGQGNENDSDPRRLSARQSFNRTIHELTNKAERARLEQIAHRQSKESSQKFSRQPPDIDKRSSHENKEEKSKKNDVSTTVMSTNNKKEEQQQQGNHETDNDNEENTTKKKKEPERCLH